MGLRQKLSEWITLAKDTFDFGPEFPTAMAARRIEFAAELAQLRHLLEETQQVAREKDKLIARLQATGAAEGNMVLDGAAYFIRKKHLLEGPYCTACFQRNHETARIMPGPRPEGADGDDWVQCAQCGTAFRSERISEYLNPHRTIPAQPEACAEENDAAKPVPALRKPRPQTRRTKERQAPGSRTTVRSRTARPQ